MIGQHDRDRIEDLGLDPDSDRTEDLRRPRNENAPGSRANGSEGCVPTHL